MKEKTKKIISNPFFPFVIFFLIIMAIHLLTYSNGDDDFFRVQLDKYNLYDYLVMRYNTWSSRVVIEALFVTVTRLPIIIWQILDSAIFTTMGILISKLFNKKNNVLINWSIILLLLIYPFTDMASAGYVCTTIAYVWPMTTLLYLVMVFYKTLESKKIKWYEYIISFISLLVTISFEQTLCLLLGILVVMFMYIIIKKKTNVREQWYMYLYFLLSSAMLVFTLTCPGNDARYFREVKYWYPIYDTFGLFDKVYLGVVPTVSVMIRNRVVMTVFSSLLCMTVFKKFKSEALRILSVIQLSFVLMFGFLYNIVVSAFPSLERFYVILNQTTSTNPTINLNYIIPFVMSCLVFAIILLLLYLIFNKDLTSIIVLGAGVASRFIMGFSPTIFASADRTAFFMYISFFIVIIMLIKELALKKEVVNKNINYALIVAAIINVMNVVYTLIIVGESL